jgi:hypothetical protein
MVTSHDTISKIHQVLARHLTGRQIRLILDDLTMVPGNQSFRETVIRLQRFHQTWAAGEREVVAQKKEEQA